MFIRKLNEGKLAPLRTNFSYKLKYFDVFTLAETFNEPPLGAYSPEDPARIVYTLMQQQDLYTALQYAEEEIIPVLLEGQFDALTEETVEGWIKGVHRRAGRTVVLDTLSNEVAGEYSSETMMINRISHHFTMEFYNALDGRVKMEEVLKRYQVPVSHSEFIAFIEKIKKDTTIKISDTPQPMPQSWIFFEKISHGLDQGLISKEDAAMFDKVLCVKKPHSTYAASMRAFAAELVARLRLWDGSRKGGIRIAAFAFQQITFIHGLPNGNYRTAATMCNSLLAGLIKKTVMLRTSEAAFADSKFTKVIRSMDESLEVLEHYIEEILDEKEKESPVLEEFNQMVAYSKPALLFAKLDEILEKIQSAVAADVAYEWGKDALKIGLAFDRAVNKSGVTLYLEKMTDQTGWKGNCKDDYHFWLPGLSDGAASEMVQRLKSMLEMYPGDDKPIISLRNEQVTKKPIVWIEDKHKNLLYIFRIGYEMHHQRGAQPMAAML
jgi:hypothetical protein